MKQAGYWVESDSGDRGIYVDGITHIFLDTGTLTSGDLQRLEISGTTLVYKLNGTSLNGAGTTDNTYSSAGKLGIYSYKFNVATNPGEGLDNWEGGNIVSTQDTPELRGRPFGLRGQVQMHQLLAQ